MPSYRIYKLNPVGQISGTPQFVDCVDDKEAIRKAQQAVDHSDVELWDDTRLIGWFPHN